MLLIWANPATLKVYPNTVFGTKKKDEKAQTADYLTRTV